MQIAILQVGSLQASLSWLSVLNFGFQNSTPNCILDISAYVRLAVLHLKLMVVQLQGKFALDALVPGFLFVELFATMLLHALVNRLRERTMPWPMYSRGFLALFLFSYQSLSSTSLKCVFCAFGKHE